MYCKLTIKDKLRCRFRGKWSRQRSKLIVWAFSYNVMFGSPANLVVRATAEIETIRLAKLNLKNSPRNFIKLSACFSIREFSHQNIPKKRKIIWMFGIFRCVKSIGFSFVWINEWRTRYMLARATCHRHESFDFPTDAKEIAYVDIM